MKRWLLIVSFVLLVGCTSQAQETHSNEEEPVKSDEQISKTNDENTKDKEKGKEEQQQSEEVSSHDDEENSDEETEDLVENPSSTPEYMVNEKIWKLEPIEKANERVVLLTIDDAPEKYALEMAKILQSLKVPAIFFVNGHFIDSEEEQKVLKEIYDLGFEIGNHTNSHPNLSKLADAEQKQEIQSLSDQIEDITGQKPSFFRAPFGVNTDYSNQLVRNEEMLAMNWSYGYDWVKEYTTSEALEDIMVNTELLQNGAILLMHDREWSKEALEDIVEGIRAKGYEFVDPAKIQTTP
jgi:peptidoglycan/xylan/chitin deacetylase (PgdA/CDA1 family)